MPTPVIEKLLVLQDRDVRRAAIEAQLKAVPRDIALVEQKIAAEKTAIENARTELRDLETKKKLVEGEIGTAQANLGKYRTQQSLVRKNDEYQALGHQIATTEAEIGKLEERELEIMYAIDEAKKRFVAAEAELKANISGHEGRIRMLREREVNLREELKTALADVAAARTPVGGPELHVYDRIAARHLPAVVPIHGGKCGGCHLKVSSEVESASRGKATGPGTQLPTCDQCGRIVYWDY
jgi:predicted  nucleic acid-binding Zn-ribbon protein